MSEGRMSAEQTPDIAALATGLARHFNPDGFGTWDERGRMSNERRGANGDDSAMIVFRDTDGQNSIRALTFNEVAAALAPVLAAAVREAEQRALREAADFLEGKLGVRGTPHSLWDFRQWLRLRADSLADRITEPASHEAATSGEEASKA